MKQNTKILLIVAAWLTVLAIAISTKTRSAFVVVPFATVIALGYFGYLTFRAVKTEDNKASVGPCCGTRNDSNQNTTPKNNEQN